MKQTRNFVIVAHIDHGKSTLADRFLEITGAVPKRQMRPQYLDQLELERERGITIKMAPVKMNYSLDGGKYILNLIDTPGHSDFSYEVSRALAAVEGAILLVDAAQGIQAQTLANFHLARRAGLKIIGALNKVDLFKNGEEKKLEKIAGDLADLLKVPPREIFYVSGKTGAGVDGLLEAVVKEIPPPETQNFEGDRALIFDSFYDNHRGVVISVRVFSGEFTTSQVVKFLAGGIETKLKEVGFFAPQLKQIEKLGEGDIGYIATGIKNPEKIKIGDTIIANPKSPPDRPAGEIRNSKNLALPGYQEPKPVVFVSFYPEDGDDYDVFKRSLEKLKLNDSAIKIEPDQNEVLGRGFKLGFLGRLHFEIVAERLKREFGVKTVNTFPSVLYRVKVKNEWVEIVKPEELPQDFSEIWEPTANVEIIVPADLLNNIFSLQNRFRFSEMTTESFHEQVKLRAKMPLAELISDFDDQLKSATGGFGSFSYEIGEYRPAEISKVDIFLSGKIVPGLSRFLPKESFLRESRRTVLRLKELLPRRQFSQAIQAVCGGRVIAREDISALRKDVTGYLYGGDRTRKMKLWQKQKKGKRKLKERGKGEVKIEPHVFRKLLEH